MLVICYDHWVMQCCMFISAIMIFIIKYEIKIFCHNVSSKIKKNTQLMNIAMHFNIVKYKNYDLIFSIISSIFFLFSNPLIKHTVLEISPISMPPDKIPFLKYSFL